MPFPTRREYLASLDSPYCGKCLKHLIVAAPTHCGHYFCRGCIGVWKWLMEDNACPSCQAPVSEQERQNIAEYVSECGDDIGEDLMDIDIDHNVNNRDASLRRPLFNGNAARNQVGGQMQPATRDTATSSPLLAGLLSLLPGLEVPTRVFDAPTERLGGLEYDSGNPNAVNSTAGPAFGQVHTRFPDLSAMYTVRDATFDSIAMCRLLERLGAHRSRPELYEETRCLDVLYTFWVCLHSVKFGCISYDMPYAYRLPLGHIEGHHWSHMNNLAGYFYHARPTDLNREVRCLMQEEAGNPLQKRCFEDRSIQ